MKHFQLVCILSTIAIAYAGGDSKENEEKITKILEECRKETSASVDDVKMLASGEFPKTKTQHCLTTCYYKKTGIINDDNTINVDKALDDLAILKKESEEVYDKLVKIMKDCNTKYTPSKECDSIKTYFECLVKSSKDAGVPLEE